MWHLPPDCEFGESINDEMPSPERAFQPETERKMDSATVTRVRIDNVLTTLTDNDLTSHFAESVRNIKEPARGS
jgi:hypothetical protein